MEQSETEEDFSKTSVLNPQTVSATIHRVQTLKLQVQDDSGPFEKSVSEDFQAVAQGLSQLETECKNLHDQLEVETIKSSKKRYALQILPEKYKKEMEESVMAARTSNEADMKLLQKRLDVAQVEAERLTNSHVAMSQENNKLNPECRQIRKEHDMIIAHLNQRMSDKANKQIVLNETRDALRDVQHHITEIDVGHENLAEDMEVVRAEAAEMKETMMKDVHIVNAAIAEQKQKNADEKRATDKILEKIMEAGVKMDEKQKELRRSENSFARLEMQSLQLADKIKREKISNQQLHFEKETLLAAKGKRQAEYDVKMEELEKKIRAVNEQLQEAQKDHEIVYNEKNVVQEKRDEANKAKSKAVAKAKKAAIKVVELKKQTRTKVEEAAAYTQSNKNVKEKLVLLEENHIATVTTFNTQIDEYKASLGEERQERFKVQEMRDESEKVLENFRNEEVKYMNDMTSSIEDARKKHNELTTKSMWLNRETLKNRRAVETLEVRLEVGQSSFRTMKETLTMDIERLKTSVELLRGDNDRKADFAQEKKPQVEQLQIELDERSVEYNHLKDEVVAVRNKEKSVNEQISRVKLLTSQLTKPNLKLKEALQEEREGGLSQLEEQAAARIKLEAAIYQTAANLEQLTNENLKFSEEGATIQTDIDTLTADMKSHAANNRLVFVELENLQKQFSEAWDVCIAMEEASADQDKKILKGIGRLQEETHERAATLNGISSNLKNELDSLTGFVENVGSRRPKDTRRGNRKSSINVFPRKPASKSEIKLHASSTGLLPPPLAATPERIRTPQTKRHSIKATKSRSGVFSQDGSRTILAPIGTT